MNSHHVPQPRYSAEYKEMASKENRPLFTLDIYHYPRKRRTTSTGVATDTEIDRMIEHLQYIKSTTVPEERKS